MPLPTLPPEIIYTLLELAWQTESLFDYQHTLAISARVAQAWTRPARSLLYRDVHMESGHYLNGHSPTSPYLSKLFADAPHIAQHVRALTISGSSVSDIPRFGSEVEQALQLCSNATLFDLWMPPAGLSAPCPHIEVALQLAGPRLRDVALRRFKWSSNMGQVLGSFTSVRRLVFDEVDMSAVTALEPQSQLQLEEFDGEGMLASSIVAAVLAGSHATLKKLSLAEYRIPSGSVFDLAPFSALHSVYLTCPLRPADPALRPALLSLKSCQTLEEVTLRHCDVRRAPLPDLTSFDLLRLIPPSVKHLDLAYVPLETEYLLDTFRDFKCLPLLQNLELDHRVWDAGLMLNPWRRPKERRPKELEGIAEAAAGRGIVVRWGALERASWDELSTDDEYENENEDGSGEEEETEEEESE